jgi:hypothetical protein
MTFENTPRRDARRFDPETVRDVLLQWQLEQGCRNPADRPTLRENLEAKIAPLFDAAAAKLVEEFSRGAPADPSMRVWKALPRLSRETCVCVAAELIELREGLPSEVPAEHP